MQINPRLCKTGRPGPRFALLAAPAGRLLTAVIFPAALLPFRQAAWFPMAGPALGVLLAAAFSLLSDGLGERMLQRPEDRDRQLCRVPGGEASADALQEGDPVLLRAGETVPADGWLTEGRLECCQAIRTGERASAEKTGAPLPKAIRWDIVHPQLLFRGSLVTAGEGVMQVLRRPMRSAADSAPRPAALQQTEGLTRIVSRAGQIAGLAAGLFVLLRHGTANGFALAQIAEILRQPETLLVLLQALSLTAALLVLTAGDGLPFLFTALLQRSSRRLRSRHILVRRPSALVRLPQRIFVEQTGFFSGEKLLPEGFLTGDGVLHRPEALHSLAVCQAVREACRLGNPAERRGKTVTGGSRIHRALLTFAGTAPVSGAAERVSADEDGCRFAVVTGGVFPVYLTGPASRLLPRCTQDWGGAPLQTETLQLAVRQQRRHGMTEVCLCGGVSPESRGLTLLGILLLREPLLSEAAAARTLAAQGASLLLLTESEPEIARGLAGRAGLPGCGTLLTGEALDRLSDRELSERLPAVGLLCRPRPGDVRRLLRLSQQEGQTVWFAGSDPDALHAASAGVTKRGSDPAAETAASVLTESGGLAALAALYFAGKQLRKDLLRLTAARMKLRVCAAVLLLLSVLYRWDAPFLCAVLPWVCLLADGLAALVFSVLPLPTQRRFPGCFR